MPSPGNPVPMGPEGYPPEGEGVPASSQGRSVALVTGGSLLTSFNPLPGQVSVCSLVETEKRTGIISKQRGTFHRKFVDLTPSLLACGSTVASSLTIGVTCLRTIDNGLGLLPV